MSVKADVDWRPLMRTFIPVWLGSIVAFALAFAMGWDGIQLLADTMTGGPGATVDPDAVVPIFQLYGYFALAFLASALLLVGYRARFHQQALDATSLGEVQFGFSATTGDWLRFYLGNIAWVVLTLGIGGLLLRYRLWRFWMEHLLIFGELDPDAVRQSRLARPVQGDGLADAFDVGGI
jgi:hypothetical protein